MERVLSYATRIYKLLVALLRDVLAERPNSLQSMLRLLLSRTAENLATKIQSYFSASSASTKNIELVASKRKRGGGGTSSGSSAANKLSKVVPGLIFQMEQLDLMLIKLSGVIAVDKPFISKLVKRSQVRDFKLKVVGGREALRIIADENVANGGGR